MSDNTNVTVMLEEIFKSRSHYIKYFKDGLTLENIIEMEIDWFRPKDDEEIGKKREQIKTDPVETKKLIISHLPGPKLIYDTKYELSNPIFDNVKSSIKIQPLDLVLSFQTGINTIEIPIIVSPSTYSTILKCDPTIINITLNEYISLLKIHTGKHVRVDNPMYQKLETRLLELSEIHTEIGTKLDKIITDQQQLKIPLDENYYGILKYNTSITIYNSSNVIIKTFTIPFIKTCAIQFNDDREIDSYIVGTLYGIVIIFNSDFRIRTILFLDGSILKIRATNHRFIIITSNKTCVFASNKCYDILIYEIFHAKEAILDCDIFGDTMACVTSTYGPKFNCYLKIYSIGKLDIGSKIQLSNGRLFIKMNNTSDIELSPTISTNGKRIGLNGMFKNNYSHALQRQWIGLFLIDLIHFNYRRTEGTFELYASIVDYDNNHITISFL
jgi:hypothetical protein